MCKKVKIEHFNQVATAQISIPQYSQYNSKLMTLTTFKFDIHYKI